MELNGLNMQTDWGTLMKLCMDAQSNVTDVEGKKTGKAVGADANLTIQNAAKQVVQRNLPLPVIEEGTNGGYVDAEAVQQAIINLKSFSKDLEGIKSGGNGQRKVTLGAPKTNGPASEPPKTNGPASDLPPVLAPSGTTDIFELVTMILSVYSKMRKATREARNSALELQKSQIRGRAAEQREAARIGMVFGIAFAVAQGCMAAASTITSLQGLGQQTKMQQASGVKAASSDLAMTNKALNVDGAKAQLTKLQNKVGAPTAQELRQTYFGTADEHSAQFGAAPHETPNGMVEMVEPAAHQPNAAQRAQIRSQYDAGMKRFDNAIAEKEGQLALKQSQPNPNKAEIKALENDIKTMKGQRSYMKAVQLEAKARFSTSEELAMDVELCKNQVDIADKQVTKSEAYMNAAWRVRLADGLGQISTAFGPVGQYLAQYMSSEHTSKATLSEAEEKESEKLFNEANESLGSQQEVINTAIKLLMAVYETEAQTNQKILS